MGRTYFDRLRVFVVELGAIDAMELPVQWVTDEDLGSDSAWLVTEWIWIFNLGGGSGASPFVVANLGGSV